MCNIDILIVERCRPKAADPFINDTRVPEVIRNGSLSLSLSLFANAPQGYGITFCIVPTILYCCITKTSRCRDTRELSNGSYQTGGLVKAWIIGILSTESASDPNVFPIPTMLLDVVPMFSFTHSVVCKV